MKNAAYEQFLSSQGVPWTYLPNLELAAIDNQKSLANQARLELAIDPDRVAFYQARYKAGEESPPLIVYRQGKGKFIILDGNQRRQACQPDGQWRGRLFLDAYLIETRDEQVLNRIAWTANIRLNGKPLTPAEAQAHALTFVRKYGFTCQQAGAEFGVSERTMHRLAALEDNKDRLREQKVKRLPADDVLIRLAPLAHLGDDIYAKAVTAVVETGASTSDIDALAKSVRRAKTHASKLASIGEFESSERAQTRRAQTKAGTIRPRYPLPREKLDRLLKETRGLLEEQRIKEVLLPTQKSDRAKLDELAADVCRLLAKLCGPHVLIVPREEAV